MSAGLLSSRCSAGAASAGDLPGAHLRCCPDWRRLSIEHHLRRRKLQAATEVASNFFTVAVACTFVAGILFSARWPARVAGGAISAAGSDRSFAADPAGDGDDARQGQGKARQASKQASTPGIRCRTSRPADPRRPYNVASASSVAPATFGGHTERRPSSSASIVDADRKGSPQLRRRHAGRFIAGAQSAASPVWPLAERRNVSLPLPAFSPYRLFFRRSL